MFVCARACVCVALTIFGGLTAQVDWLGLRVGGHPALSLHSSNEPGHRVYGHDTIAILWV